MRIIIKSDILLHYIALEMICTQLLMICLQQFRKPFQLPVRKHIKTQYNAFSKTENDVFGDKDFAMLI